MPFSSLPAINPFLEFIGGDKRFEDEDSDEWAAFDLIAVDAALQGVAINLWILNPNTFDDIAHFKRDSITSYTDKQPSKTKDYKIFNGGKCTLDRNVKPFGNGYKLDRPFLYDGKLLSENYILNNMFFVFPIFGADYSNKAVNEMWDAFLGKYPNVTAEQIYSFIIEKVTSRFSPDFKAKLKTNIDSRLAGRQ